MIPEPETLARMFAAVCMLGVGASVVALVGWLIKL